MKQLSMWSVADCTFLHLLQNQLGQWRYSLCGWRTSGCLWKLLRNV